jgi:hypothetical protein
MAPILFWVPTIGTGAVRIEFSKNKALLLMGDWCGSNNFSATETNEMNGCEIDRFFGPGSVSSSIKLRSGEVFFRLTSPLMGESFHG